ncbi:site-specific integrase [Nocardiopsis ansamitocini]|uniref:Integrase n=1 Tax=Nocardiopsis ansamitocini TaxID=1670832 RepID=A0A9W6P3A7_9ACTN|nr:tyrosine-type recombinase/integrase [Nocardiopsis ansamitocini]GLU46317.1 integrase [Nocardiopsis ansamitocini]
MDDTTYDVRIWKKIEVYRGKRKTTHTVRWRVGSQEFREPHSTAAMADSFRSSLVAATNRGEAFGVTTGRPASWARAEEEAVSWFSFVRGYIDAHWSGVSAGHRLDRAKYLAKASMAMLDERAPGRPGDQVLRAALRNWWLNKTHRERESPAEVEAALEWLERHTLPVKRLEDPVVARRVLTLATSKFDESGGGSLGAKAATKSKRILSHCLDFAVERGHLAANPVSYHRNPAGAIKWKPPKVNNQVDKRSVPNPRQARRLLDAVGEEGRSGHLLRPFFAVMYFAALRPEEAVNLRWRDVTLPGYVWDAGRGEWIVPGSEWGEINVREVAPDVGRRWTDSGRQRDTRPPKGRAEGESRPVPCVPLLSRILRDHRAVPEQGPDGLVFFGEKGRQLATSTYSKVWRRARGRALAPQEFESPLAQRPYDLRSACVSAWLTNGTQPRQVAEWAGHGLDVLLRIYARILDGSEEESRRRMEGGFEGF